MDFQQLMRKAQANQTVKEKRVSMCVLFFHNWAYIHTCFDTLYAYILVGSFVHLQWHQ